MQNIIQLSQEDLKFEIREAIREILLDLNTKQLEADQPQRGGIELAEQVLGRSPSWIYKATMQNRIPFKRFNNTLIFDRQELVDWMAERTVSPNQNSDIMSDRLAKSAKKKLSKV
jgi:hypothetical protein